MGDCKRPGQLKKYGDWGTTEIIVLECSSPPEFIKRRIKKDLIFFMKDNLCRYQTARKLAPIIENLNTHFPMSITDTFGDGVEIECFHR